MPIQDFDRIQVTESALGCLKPLGMQMRPHCCMSWRLGLLPWRLEYGVIESWIAPFPEGPAPENPGLSSFPYVSSPGNQAAPENHSFMRLTEK